MFCCSVSGRTLYPGQKIELIEESAQCPPGTKGMIIDFFPKQDLIWIKDESNQEWIVFVDDVKLEDVRYDDNEENLGEKFHNIE